MFAGLTQGDVILEIDQVAIKKLREFHRKIQEYKKGNTILLIDQAGRVYPLPDSEGSK